MPPVITEESYQNLYNMITSHDKSNITIALEIMSNCNIEASYDKLACLIYYNGFILKHSGSWNTINVKALRKRMDHFCNLYEYQVENNARVYNNFLLRLEKENFLTPFAVKITCEYLFKNVITVIFGSDSMFDFKLSDIKLKPEYMAKMKQNESGINIYENLQLLL